MFYNEEGPFKSSNPELLDNGDGPYTEVKAAGGGSGNGGGSSSK